MHSTAPAPADSSAEATRPASWLGALLIVLTVAALATLAVRTPRLETTPGLMNALAQAQAQARSPRDALVRHLANHPRDARGWVLLAILEFEADRYEAAATAFERAVDASPTRVARDPGVLCDWADALAMTQGGSLAGRPTELVERALSLRADHPKALEMAGSAAFERRDFASAVTHWRRLLPMLDESSGMQPQLQAAIDRAEKLAATSLK